MKTNIIIFTFILSALIFSKNVKSQSFIYTKVKSYDKIHLLLDTLDNINPKVVFTENYPIFLYNKGVPASDVNIEMPRTAKLKGFSKQNYIFTYKQKEYNLPFLKIRFNSINNNYWAHSTYPFIFDDNHPDVFFTVDNIKYNVYSAKSTRFIKEDYYDGYELILIKNTNTKNYKLLICKSFPKALQGHSYGCKYVYLQNDLGVNEKITEATNNNGTITLLIEAKYQEGGASYKINFKISDNKPKAKYWHIKMN